MLYIQGMDKIRSRVRDRAEALGISLKELSTAIGKNPSYVHQFITKEIPRELPERVRHRLAQKLQMDESELRSFDEIATLTRMPPGGYPAPPHVSAPGATMQEGRQIGSADALPAEIAAFIKGLAQPGRQLEFWQLETDALDDEGYRAGDYLAVEIGPYQARDPVLAMDMVEDAPLFRVANPPYLTLGVYRAGAKPLLIDNDRIIVKGPIVAVARLRRN